MCEGGIKSWDVCQKVSAPKNKKQKKKKTKKDLENRILA
jgi:hypothetical protein